MNQFATNWRAGNPDCAGSAGLAERELAAFLGAVTELYGPELAEFAAEEWLREVEATDNLPASAREWRRVTVKVSARLANRTLSSPQLNRNCGGGRFAHFPQRARRVSPVPQFLRNSGCCAFQVDRTVF